VRKKYLVITVGGSDEPIVTSIETSKPDFVYFLCSGDSEYAPGSYQTVDREGDPCGVTVICSHCGKPSGEKRDSIVCQAELEKSSYKILKINCFDEFDKCYMQSVEVFNEIRANNPDAIIIADYTGGTKSMSAGLASAAVDDGQVDICIVTGPRRNLHKISQTHSARLIGVNNVLVSKKLATINDFWKDFEYQACITLINDLLISRQLDPVITKRLEKIKELCTGFELWDCFDHDKAYTYLNNFKTDLNDQIKFLGQIKSVQKNWPGNGDGTDILARLASLGKMSRNERSRIFNFAPVIDLCLNAMRRANRGRYDDAVARIYRALEMFAQINLLRWEQPLYTSRLNLEQLPNGLKNKYGGNRRASSRNLEIGLRQAYCLLADLNTPAGKVFIKHDKKIRQLLEKRNYSIMAHGIVPIAKDDFNKSFRHFKDFIEEACEATGSEKPDFKALQFPSDFLETKGYLKFD